MPYSPNFSINILWSVVLKPLKKSNKQWIFPLSTYSYQCCLLFTVWAPLVLLICWLTSTFSVWRFRRKLAVRAQLQSRKLFTLSSVQSVKVMWLWRCLCVCLTAWKTGQIWTWWSQRKKLEPLTLLQGSTLSGNMLHKNLVANEFHWHFMLCSVSCSARLRAVRWESLKHVFSVTTADRASGIKRQIWSRCEGKWRARLKNDCCYLLPPKLLPPCFYPPLFILASLCTWREIADWAASTSGRFRRYLNL